MTVSDSNNIEDSNNNEDLKKINKRFLSSWKL